MREIGGIAEPPESHSVADVIAETAEYFLPSEEEKEQQARNLLEF